MKKRAERRQLAECSSYDAAWITQHLIVAQKNERERKRREKRTSEARAVGRAREGTEGYERRWNGDDGEGRTGEGVGGGGNGDVLAKVTAGNAVYVRRSKVACRVAELFSFSRSIFPSALSLPLPSCSLRCRHPLLLVRPFVSISLLLSLLSDPEARRRLQECTKCTALTDARPRSTASTYLLRPFASLRSSLFFSLLSQSFVSFFPGRLLRLRGPLSHPLHRSAAAAVVAAATPGNGPLFYHRVVVRLFSPRPRSYDRTYD